MKAHALAIFLTLSLGSPAIAGFSLPAPVRHPNDPKLAGIVVVSDFHLYDPDYSFDLIKDPVKRESEKLKAAKNLQAYARMLGAISDQPAVTNVIMNGDILHAPTLVKLTDEARIERMIDVLMQMSTVLNKPLYFNFGNHDVTMEMKGTELLEVPGFAQKFEAALNAAIEKQTATTGRTPIIRIIGVGEEGFGKYRTVYDITVGGKKIRISHAPFVSTNAIADQAKLFEESNPRAFTKVTAPHRLTENPEGILYIQSDSHTPAADAKLGVYNTGMLTVDDTVPFPEPTFIVLDGEASGHFTFARDATQPLLSYRIPTCPGLFSP